MKIQILLEKKSEKKSVFPVGEIWGANSYFFQLNYYPMHQTILKFRWDLVDSEVEAKFSDFKSKIPYIFFYFSQFFAFV